MYIIYFINQNGNTVGKWEVEELPRVGGGIVLPKDIYFIESLAEEDRKNDNIYIRIYTYIG